MSVSVCVCANLNVKEETTIDNLFIFKWFIYLNSDNESKWRWEFWTAVWTILIDRYFNILHDQFALCSILQQQNRISILSA